MQVSVAGLEEDGGRRGRVASEATESVGWRMSGEVDSSTRAGEEWKHGEQARQRSAGGREEGRGKS